MVPNVTTGTITNEATEKLFEKESVSTFHLTRCRSENKFPDPLQNMVVRPASPTPSAPERLRAPEDECSALRQQPLSASSRHVSWGGATSTIRATYRFSSGKVTYIRLALITHSNDIIHVYSLIFLCLGAIYIGTPLLLMVVITGTWLIWVQCEKC